MRKKTFMEIIEAANHSSGFEHGGFHIWAEYADGSRGYYTTRRTIETARMIASKLTAATIYDREGNEVE